MSYTHYLYYYRYIKNCIYVGLYGIVITLHKQGEIRKLHDVDTQRNIILY